MNDEYVREVAASVKAAARHAETRWNGVMEADDIEQELWMFIMESPSVQRALEQLQEQDRVARLHTKANSIVSREKLSYDHFTGNYHYTPSDVRELLEQLGKEEEISLEERLDLELGIELLKDQHESYYTALKSWYVLGIPAESGAAKRKLYRAVDKLADLMNRKRSQRELDRVEGLGTKKEVFNHG